MAEPGRPVRARGLGGTRNFQSLHERVVVMLAQRNQARMSLHG
jgi:hypothetical protein